MSTDLTTLVSQLEGQSPQEVLALALRRFDAIAISFSGAEDVVLIDMAAKQSYPFQVFTLDTGRLHTETYQFIENVGKHYGITIEVLFPDTQELQTFVSTKGFFSFYKDGHKECCGIRKVRPLRRKLATLDAWITGQRQDQSPDTRANIPTVQVDSAFSTADHSLIKFNPLTHWTSAQVWEYIRKYEVPYNPLHRQGLISIGCEPCTRAILPGQHERDGRWWWENPAEKECGLHADNLKADNGKTDQPQLSTIR